MRVFDIDGTRVADDLPPYIVAEIGHNHAHRMERAFAMVDSAIASGASAVKFQTRSPEETYQAGTMQGAYHYQSDNPQWMDPVYGEHRKKLEPTKDEWRELFNYCQSNQITAFSTPFDFASLELLESIGVPAYKVASGDATNIPFIRAIAEIGKPTIISTGGIFQPDVDRIVDEFARAVPASIWDWNMRLALLQCTCVYPCPSEAMNLKVISTYRDRYQGLTVGLSTHNPSWYPSLAAYGLGARIFEHHYTNNRQWKGTDNHFSLTPTSLAEFVKALGEAHAAMGTNYKSRDEIERGPAHERQKSLVWARRVGEFETVTRDDIKIQCPGDGLPPYYLDLIVGKQTSRMTGMNALVGWQDILIRNRDVPEFEKAALRVARGDLDFGRVPAGVK